jgi:hypothetical protein
MGILKSWPSWLSWGSGETREDGDLARALDGGFAGEHMNTEETDEF